MRRDIGELLVAMGIITREQWQQAREVAKTTRGEIGRVLVDLYFATERDVLEAQAEVEGLRFVDLPTFTIDPGAITALPADVARRHHVMPIVRDSKGVLVVAMADPRNILAIDALRRASGGLKIEPVLAWGEAIQQALNKHYPPGADTGQPGSVDAGK